MHKGSGFQNSNTKHLAGDEPRESDVYMVEKGPEAMVYSSCVGGQWGHNSTGMGFLWYISQIFNIVRFWDCLILV